MSLEMGKNPPQILFRILRPDEVNGLAGVVSRNISSNIPEEQLPPCTIAQHVADNPKLTPYISTSTDLKKQMHFIKKNLFEGRRPAIYMIVIDTVILKRQGSEITNFNNTKIRRKHMGGNRKATKYARAWSEVIIRDRIPTEAIIESIRCTYDFCANRVERKIFPNPRYAGSIGACMTGRSV